MKNRRTRIVFPVFNGYEVRVIAAQNIVATGRRLGVNLSGFAAGFVTTPGEPLAWIVLQPGVTAGTIAHEAAHAIRAIHEYVGAGLDDEVFAYHLEHLVDKLHAFMAERA